MPTPKCLEPSNPAPPIPHRARDWNAAALVAITLQTLRLARVQLDDGEDGGRGAGGRAVAIDEHGGGGG